MRSAARHGNGGFSPLEMLVGMALDGGGPGECGENIVRRLDGRMEKLEGCDQTVIDAGEAIIIKTPSGGGYGRI